MTIYIALACALTAYEKATMVIMMNCTMMHVHNQLDSGDVVDDDDDADDNN